MVLSAGSSNVDASTTSPARVAAAIVVGALGLSNVKAPFSNYGCEKTSLYILCVSCSAFSPSLILPSAVIDCWAPGTNILSAWIGSPTATNILSGTSMAAAYVTGVVAVILSKYGNMTPAQLSDMLKAHGSPIVTGVPSGTT